MRWKAKWTGGCVMLAAVVALLTGGVADALPGAPAPTAEPAPHQPRLVVLTDIGNEPDDAQSLVRLLLYANVLDLEGLIATTSTWLRDTVQVDQIYGHLDAYEQARPNLTAHADGYPTAAALRRVVRAGQPGYGMDAVGDGRRSPGSDLLIQAVDRPDPRPVWVAAWGGANTLAQALWTVRRTRRPEAVQAFVSRLRVYAIADQDDAGPWIRATFPDLFYIVSPTDNSAEGYRHATWVGISGERYYGSFTGPDTALVDQPWLDAHVRTGHGPLGARYPATAYIMEGDTPSFLNLIPNGLSADESPAFGGWGGRYRLRQPPGEARPIWTDDPDAAVGVDGRLHTANQATIWRWRTAYQHDFAARMDWAAAADYGAANHPPVPLLNGAAGTHARRLQARPGQRLYLSAEGSHDPDRRDAVAFQWWVYPEAGTYQGDVLLEDATAEQARLVVPEQAGGTTIHVVLAVTDTGTPALTRYRRAIVEVTNTP